MPTSSVKRCSSREPAVNPGRPNIDRVPNRPLFSLFPSLGLKCKVFRLCDSNPIVLVLGMRRPTFRVPVLIHWSPSFTS